MKERFNRFFIKLLTVLMLITSFNNNFVLGVTALVTNEWVEIYSDPISQSNVSTGSNRTFYVGANSLVSGQTLTYQWQVNDGTNGWVDITSSNAGSTYSNYTTNTLSVSSINYTLNNYQYKVVIGNSVDSNTVESNAATLTVVPLQFMDTSMSDRYVDASETYSDVTFDAYLQIGAYANLEYTVNWYVSYIDDGDNYVTYEKIYEDTNPTFVSGDGYAFVKSSLTLQTKKVGSYTYFDYNSLYTDFRFDDIKAVITRVIDGESASDTAIIRYNATAPTLTSGTPEDKSVLINADPSFGVDASAINSSEDLSYEWQICTTGDSCTADSNDWTFIKDLTDNSKYSNYTTRTLSLTDVTSSMDGYQYRVIVTATAGNDSTAESTSDVATLTVLPLRDPFISSNPTNQTVQSGQTATFNVEANSPEGGDLTYQWEESTDGENWSTITGETNTSYSVVASSSNDGHYYRVVVYNNLTGETSTSANSVPAQLIIPASEPSFSESDSGPTNANVDIFGDTQFSITFDESTYTDGSISYQWQMSTNGGSSWSSLSNTENPVPNTTSYSGVTTKTLSITDALYAMNNNKYRVVITNTKSETNYSTYETSSATLTVNPATTPTFNSNLSTTPVDSGTEITLSVGIESINDGGTQSVQWFVSSDNGNTWTETGTDSYDLSVVVTSENEYDQYYAVVTNTLGDDSRDSADSSIATLKLNPLVPSISSTSGEYPVDATGDIEGSVSYSAKSTSDDDGIISYQWWVSENSGETWNQVDLSEGSNYSVSLVDGLSTLTISSLAYGMDGNLYKVIVLNTKNGVVNDDTESDPVSLTVNKSAQVTSAEVDGNLDPVSTEVAGGENATFSVSVEGSGTITYQWQKLVNSVWTNISGQTSSTYTIYNVAAGDNGSQYRVLITNEVGDDADGWTTYPSSSATLTVSTYVPTINSEDQPMDKTVSILGDTNFSVIASSGDDGDITYQWQILDGEEFVNINDLNSGTIYSGYKSQTLTITGALYPMNNSTYRVIVTNTKNGSSEVLVSNEVTLTVNKSELPVISTQPNDVYAELDGNSDTLEVVVEDLTVTTYTYQWQVCDYGTECDIDSNWTDVENTGTDPSKLIVSNVTSTNDNDYYRVIITNEVGDDSDGWSSVTSNVVQLYINPVKPTIDSLTDTSNDDTYINPNKDISYNVIVSKPASDTGTISYQWQYWDVNTWKDLSNGNFIVDTDTLMTVSGVTNSSLDLTSVNYLMDQAQFRVVVTNTKGSKTAVQASDGIYLNIHTPASKPIYTSLINDLSSTVNIGADPQFTANIQSAGMGTVTYVWQVRTSSTADWTDLSDTSATDINNNTATPSIYSQLTLNDVTYDMNGYQYRVVATNLYHETTAEQASGIVTLTVNPPAVEPTVDTQPESVKETLGGSVTFTALASSTDEGEITYQWQYSTNGSTWSDISGATSSTYTINPTTADDEVQYRAVITNTKNGTTEVIETDVATLDLVAVKYPEFTQSMPVVSTTEGNTVTYYANATSPDEGVLSYAWEVSTDGGETWTTITGETSDKLVLSNVTTSMSGYKYRAIVTNTLKDEFISLTSSVASLSVNAKVVSNTSSSTTTTTETASTTTTVANTTTNPTNTTDTTDETNTDDVTVENGFFSSLTVTKNVDGSSTISGQSAITTKPLIAGISTAVVIPEENDENTESVVIEFISEENTVSSEKLNDSVKNSLAIMAEDGTSFDFVYDLSLLKTVTSKDGTVTQTKIENSDITGELIIRLPIPDGLMNDINHRIVYIAEDGTTQVIESTRVDVDGIAYLEFRINHLSYYAVMADKVSAAVEEVVEESSNMFIFYGSAFVVALLGLIWFILGKRKKDEEYA